MNVMMEIALESARILSLLFGFVGLAFSILLLFSPVVTRRICDVVNHPVLLENNTRYLNTYIAFDRLAHRHHALVGLLIAAGSAFISLFFWGTLDDRFLGDLFGRITIEFAITLGRVIGPIGMALGLMLAIRPAALLRIETSVNRWISTEPFVDSLNQMRYPIDSMVFRHPLIFGVVGMIASTVLIVLSLLRLLVA